MQKKVMIRATIGLLATVAIVFGWLRDGSVSLPAESDITEIRVDLNGFRPEMSGFITNDVTFIKEDYGQLLKLFANAERTRRPSKWQVLGLLTIRTSGGQTTAIDLYSTYSTRGAFRIGRKYFRTASEPAMMKFLVSSARPTPTKK